MQYWLTSQRRVQGLTSNSQLCIRRQALWKVWVCSPSLTSRVDRNTYAIVIVYLQGVCLYCLVYVPRYNLCCVMNIFVACQRLRFGQWALSGRTKFVLRLLLILKPSMAQFKAPLVFVTCQPSQFQTVTCIIEGVQPNELHDTN